MAFTALQRVPFALLKSCPGADPNSAMIASRSCWAFFRISTGPAYFIDLLLPLVLEVDK
jgi:hypothetical protein